MNDLKFAFRQLLKNPGFTAVAVLTLALGIGVNVAVFSMANAVLWRPLPFPEPNRLMALGEGNLRYGSRSGVSAAHFSQWRERCRSFSDIAAFRTTALNLGGMADPERVLGAEISEDFFKTLRVHPQLGRFFNSTEFGSGNQEAVLLSHRLWKRRFGASTEAVKQTIKLNGESYTVIGVVPQNVESLQESVDIWMPLAITPELLRNREVPSYGVYARLRPGISIEQARSEMKNIAAQLAADFPSVYRHLEIWLSPLGERSGGSRPVFLFLLGVTGAILIIACANLASLLLVRSVHRRGEVCVRSALGASRARMIRQLLTESLALSIAGGGLGLLFAKWGSDLLKSALPAGLATHLPGFMQIQLDWRVLTVAFAVCLMAALLFGLVPAIDASKVNLSSGLQGGGRDLSGGYQARRLSLIFITTQIAVCFATVLFTAICFKSLRQAIEVNVTFDSKNLLTFEMTLAGPSFARIEQRAAFLEQLTEKVNGLPGVRSVSSADSVPFGSPGFRRVSPASSTTKDDKMLDSYAVEVAPDYFKALGIPLLRGRGFTRQDNLEALPVAIVSDYLALRLFGNGKNPLGRRIRIEGDSREIEIVGVVPNVQQSLLGTLRSQTMNLYLSQFQFCGQRAMMALRTEKYPKELVASIRKAVIELNPDLPLFAVHTMDELIALDQQFFRYLIWCMAVFAILAIGLAVVGIYGTVAYSVAQRTREFGVRMALGATIPRVLMLVVFQAVRPIAVGLLFGISASIWLVHPLILALFYNVAHAEPSMFLVIALALTISTGVACLFPAIAATRVNPMEALRYE